MDSKKIVLSFWQAMETNDYFKASKWLSEDFRCNWPQSSEIIVGRKNFAELNSNYPVNGPWSFTVNSIMAEKNKVVTDVTATNGQIIARAITFHTIQNGLIQEQTEFWPDEYAAPEWRKKWVVETKPDS